MSMLRERTVGIADHQLEDAAGYPEIWAGEVMAFCPQCKTLQAIWLNGNALMPNRKFSQIGDQVYHECGSSQPCRLYNNW